MERKNLSGLPLCATSVNSGSSQMMIKVKDYCHHTGEYRGAAHNECNRKYRLKHEVPVFFHNFSKYDAHLFIKELAEATADKNISIIPTNAETYVAVTAKVKLEENAQRIKRRKSSGTPKDAYLYVVPAAVGEWLGRSSHNRATRV